jgi:hypothetical protein
VRLRHKLSQIAIFGIAIITVLGTLMSSCHTDDNQVSPLSLQILYPNDGIEISTNLLKVRGEALPPDATVYINGIQANVNQEDSTFYSYIELYEGENKI